MTHRLDSDDFFIQRIQGLCAQQGLNFFLIEPLWVQSFHQALEQGTVWARWLLNLHSEHHDPSEIYHRLVLLADARGVRVIDPPDRALAAFNKAKAHGQLSAAGLNLPPTVIVPRQALATFRFTAEQRELLGNPFVVKPSMGYGRKGVILDAQSESDLLRSEVAWPDEHYLVQRRLMPRRIGAEPAYFRVYHVFGKLWCCWWNPFTDRFRQVSDVERETLGLEALDVIALKIASVTGMQFFSTEILQTDDGTFTVIDYMNDQCHLLTQSASPSNGVPDAVVAGIAESLVAVVAGSRRT